MSKTGSIVSLAKLSQNKIVSISSQEWVWMSQNWVNAEMVKQSSLDTVKSKEIMTKKL